MTKVVNEAVVQSTAPPAEEPLAQLTQELGALKTAFEQFRQIQPETEQIRKELTAATQDRDHANAELHQIKRQQALQSLAEENHFNDVEYLDYLLVKRNLDPTDKSAGQKFLNEFRNTNPRFFQLNMQSGSGSRPDADGNYALRGNAGSINELEVMLESAPELY